MPRRKKVVKKRSKALTINFGVLGQENSKKKFPAGTTVRDVIERYNLQGLIVRLNGEIVDEGTKLSSGDTFIAVPSVKGGYSSF